MMGEFYGIDCGIGQNTAAAAASRAKMEAAWTQLELEWDGLERLNRCANENAGVYGSCGYSYSLPGELPTDLVGGWRCQWIAGMGMGNHGVLVLIPSNALQRAQIRAGTLRKLVEDYELPEGEARKLVLYMGDRPMWKFFTFSSSTDRRMYGDSWSQVLEVHRTAGEIIQHMSGRCGCPDDDWDEWEAEDGATWDERSSPQIDVDEYAHLEDESPKVMGMRRR